MKQFIRASELTMRPISIAVRAAVVGLSLSLVTPVLLAAEAQVVNSKVSYDISAGTLQSVLDKFARSAGINLNYKPEQLAGKQSPGVAGNLSSQEALNQLLTGTGLNAVPSVGGFDLKLEINEEYTLDLINVYGRQKNDTLDSIPQTLTVFEQKSLTAGTADSVGDVIESVASASRSGSSLDMFSDHYLIRGFDSEQATNGLGFRRTDHPTDLANVERIEVLKGPSSVLFGQMEPGGTVNVVTKQPLDYFQANTSLEYGRYDQVRTTLDVTGPINDKVRARLNLAYQEGDASVDNLDYQRVLIAPNVTMDLTETTNLTIEGSYSGNEWQGIHGGAPLEGSILNNPNGDYGESFNPAGSDSNTERNSKSINIRLTEALTDNIDARMSYTYTKNEADWNEYVPWGLDDSDYRTLDRIVFTGENTYKKDHEIVLDLSGEFETGMLDHTFIIGVNYRDTKGSRPTRLYSANAVDLYSPQYIEAELIDANLMRNRGFKEKEKVAAAFIQDRISFNDDIHVLAGLRYTDSEISQVTIDHLDNDSKDRASLSESAWTSQVGILYDFSEQASIYANRSESFVPQQGTTSGAKPLEAEEGIQYEIGLRMDVGDMQVNVAGFVIDKENIAIEDPLDDDFEVAKGSARSKGIELSVGGQLSKNWYLNAVYGYTDTEILKSDDDELEGNKFANVPLHTASLQTRYQLQTVPGLSLGGKVIYVDDRPGDDDNSFELPSYTRVDIAAYYQVNKQIQLDLMVDNLLDEEIFTPGSFDGVVREPERTVMARIKYHF